MAATRAILLRDVTATKFDTGTKYAFKKFIGSSSWSNITVLRGELVTRIMMEDTEFNYILYRDSSVYLYGDEYDVAPLYGEDFSLLEAIKEPGNRINAFNNKLEWGSHLKEGASVSVTVKGPNLSVEERARAVVHYKGPIGNLPGIFFGVELMRGQHRKANVGTTDGTFQDRRYFKCEDGCGLFVPLHLISPTDDSQTSDHLEYTRKERSKHNSNPSPSYSAAVGRKERTPSRHDAIGSSVDPPSKRPSEFTAGQHVVFHSKQGVKHFGVVMWTGRKHVRKDAKDAPRTFEYPVVGIKTDKTVYMSDFENSISGMSHLLKSIPVNKTLFLPEMLVECQVGDSAPLQVESMPSKSSSEIKMSPKEMFKQRVALEEIEKMKAKTDRDSIAAVKAAGESINMTKQKDALLKFQAEKEAKQQNNLEPEKTATDEDMYGAAVPGEEMKQGGGQGKNHIYDTLSSVAPHADQGNKHRPIPYSQPAGFHGGGQYAGSYTDTDPIQREGSGAPNWQHSDHNDHSRHVQQQQSRPPIESGNQYGHHQELHQHFGSGTVEYQNEEYSPNAAQISTYPEHHSVPHPQSSEGQVHAAVATGVDASLDLTEGSMIQLSTSDSHNSVRYGVIKWIGVLPNVKGRIAGVELDEFMDGCTDGTNQQTKQKFFNCPYGKGLYYPLANLLPDERYAPAVAADGNPLKHVSEVEEMAPVDLPLENYVGDEKGIQGHQNSCYLDATLFGLFALTHDFDDMFLQNAESSTIGKILWKSIVNPLRKNGVVKYECVMELREQLDQLGKMKGITQDEKDPEEFLNLMFKHTLQVEPFISIRRPFGVEKEYFVQLFLDMDEAQKSPSIADLMDKMFAEQNISFTEVPSKLLIQVPRFGKKFKTFQKVIPARTMNVAKNVDLKNPLACYNCQEAAHKICRECTVGYGGSVPAFCDKCLGLVHNKARRSHKWEWSQEIHNLMGLAEFELLSVICIETSHYVCFVREDDRWIFFDSMANRVYDKYNIPKVVDCTDVLNEWVYPESHNLTRLLQTPPRELPEYVRRFTQDIYMCVYIQPDMAMYK